MREGWRSPAVALGAVLAVGAVLRLLMVLAWQPGLFGWPDAASYINVSQGELFSNELRPAGYPLVLLILHAITPSITLVVVVQHLLGLATAALLYLAVGRTGAPRALGLIPAAIVALGGDGIFLEHAPISEAVFTFLVAAALYAAARSLGDRGLAWPMLLGLILATAASVRVVALPLVFLLAVALVAVTAAPLRHRLATGAAVAAGALAVLVPYQVAAELSVGKSGLSRNGAWNIYGRVAPFADCATFTPPPGTERLCETTPRSRRPLTAHYTFNWYYSPAIRSFGDPHSATRQQTAQVTAFARAVILNQPLDYAEEVGAGLLRYIAPESFRGYGGGPSYRGLVHREILFHRTFQTLGREVAAEYYTDAGRFTADRTLLSALRGWESVTRVQGALFLALAALAAGAPLLTRGLLRHASIVFVLVAGTLLVIPVATVEFSARTAVPGFGPLGAAAALGLCGLVAAVRARRRSPALTRSPQPLDLGA